jgi:hypothetical protein
MISLPSLDLLLFLLRGLNFFQVLTLLKVQLLFPRHELRENLLLLLLPRQTAKKINARGAVGGVQTAREDQERNTAYIQVVHFKDRQSENSC